MNRVAAKVPFPPSAKVSQCDPVDDDSFYGIASAVSPMESSDSMSSKSPRDVVNADSFKFKTFVRTCQQRIKSANRYSKFDATSQHSSSSTIPRSLTGQFETTSYSYDTEQQKGNTMAGQDRGSCETSHTDVPFDQAIDTFLEASDDIATVSREETGLVDDATPLGIVASVVVDEVDNPVVNHHSSLIRDIEDASSFDTDIDSTSRELDFKDDSDLIQTPRRVNIQDSMNTVRYFSRSREEKKFFRRKTSRNVSAGPPAYSTPLEDFPMIHIPTRNEDHVFVSVTDTVTEAGFRILDSIEQLKKWADENNLAKKKEGPSTECTRSKLGGMKTVGQGFGSIDVSGSWEETSSTLLGTVFQFTETMRCLALCTQRLDESSHYGIDEGIEISLDELPQDAKEAPLVTLVPQSSDISSTGKSHCDQTSAPNGNDHADPTLVSKEWSSDDSSARPSKSVSRARKLEVVNAARRWNVANQSPKKAPDELPRFLELEPPPDEPDLQQPLLDDSWIVKASEELPRSLELEPPPDGPDLPQPLLDDSWIEFPTWERSPNVVLQRDWKSTVTMTMKSPISTVDI